MGRIKAREDLLELLKESPNGVGLEVGVQEGLFSKEILEVWGGKLYMVDAWREFEGYEDVANVPDEIHSLKMMTAVQNTNKYKDRRCVICETSERAALIFPDYFFDFIYLDANHSKEGVIKDLNSWYPKLKKGGIMCGDDYMDGMINGWANFGVKSGVNEWNETERKENPLASPRYEIHEISYKGEIPQWWFRRCKV